MQRLISRIRSSIRNLSRFKKIFTLWFLFEFNLGIFWSIWSVNILDQGHSYSETSIALAIYLLVIALLETPTGWIADKFGHRATCISGIIISSLGFFCLSFAGKTIVLYSSLGMAALGMALLNGSKQIWFIDTARQQDPGMTRDSLLIDLEVPRRLAQIVGAYLGTGLSQINTAYTWYMIALSGLIAFMVALKTPAGKKTVSTLKSDSHNATQNDHGPFAAIKTPALTIIYIATFIYGVDLAIRGLILSPYVIKILSHGNATNMGTVTLVGATMGLLGNKFYKSITKKYQLDKTIFMIISLVVYSFSESVFSQTLNFKLFLALYGMCIFTMGWFVSLHDAIVLDFIDEKNRAFFLSVASMLRNFSAACTLLILAPRTKELAQFQSYWQFSAIALLSCGFLYQCLYMMRKYHLSPQKQVKEAPMRVLKEVDSRHRS